MTHKLLNFLKCQSCSLEEGLTEGRFSAHAFDCQVRFSRFIVLLTMSLRCHSGTRLVSELAISNSVVAPRVLSLTRLALCVQQGFLTPRLTRRARGTQRNHVNSASRAPVDAFVLFSGRWVRANPSYGTGAPFQCSIRRRYLVR